MSALRNRDGTDSYSQLILAAREKDEYELCK